MKKIFLLFIFLPGIFHSSFAQSLRDSLLQLKAEPGQVLAIKGNLADGAPMDDLSWAWNSAVACFPQTQVRKFTGHHVLYAIDLPSYSSMDIKVEPADKNANFSAYAYMVGTLKEDNIVPNLSSCVRCEVDHKWDYKVRGKTQDHTRQVKDILALRNPYQVLIGVVGAEGLTQGDYTLYIRINK